MTVAEHLVATTRGGARSLLEPLYARWLWERLRLNLPDAFSCLLMPDHLHLVVPPGARPLLVRILASFTSRFGVRFDVVHVEPASSSAIAARMIRYGLLNPVRSGLVDDPWKWHWSTLRDLGGAVHPVWTDATAVARRLAVPPANLLTKLSTTADERPAPPRFTPLVAATFDGLRDAAAAALRLEPAKALGDRLGRLLIVQAAHAIALPDAERLAAALGCSGRTVRRHRAARHPALDAVLLCLVDPRLRVHEPARSGESKALTRRF